MKFLTLCLLTINATIPEEINYYPTEGKTAQKASYTLSPSDSFANCPCDLTVGACDEACCCDADCDASIKKMWQTQGGICSKQDIARMNLASCVEDVTKKQLGDISNGLKYFSKFPSLLMCPAKQGKVEDTEAFIKPVTVDSTGDIVGAKIDYV